MSTTDDSAGQSGTGQNRSQVMRVVASVAIVGSLVIGGALWLIFRENSRQEQGESWAFRRFGLADAVPNKLASKFRDEDKDLVADPPDQNDVTRPDTLTFSYIADQLDSDPEKSWRPFMDRMQEAVGIPVKYCAFETVTQQLEAMEKGELHVTALNTGSVPRAVNQSGFVPVSVKADTNGEWKISMKLIVPARSPLSSVQDLRGGFITFTNMNSFSGFKFAIVTLLREFNMRPGTDYEYRFSTSHEHSMAGVASGELEAALVASDLLEAAYEKGTIQRDQVKEIFTSEVFPAAAFGYVYNLAPEIAEKVRGFLTDRDLTGSPIATGAGAVDSGRLVTTNYLNDWAAVRKVDDSVREES